jgi:hypothetical protein
MNLHLKDYDSEMIICRPQIRSFLNLELISVVQQLGADLVDKIEILQQSPEIVCFRCHLKTPILPLFFHLRVQRTADLFQVSNVEDDFPGVQLFAENTYCELTFLDEDTVDVGGNFALSGVPPTVERGVKKLILQLGERLKVFLEKN